MAPPVRPYIKPGPLMTYVVNPLMRRLGLVPTLLVRGRRSGRQLAVPLGEPLEFEGSRYLVSGRGNTQWVRNLRAAGGADFRFHGVTQAFRAVEVDGGERARILTAYRAKLGRSVDGYFRKIPDPADHPVFRMDPMTEPESPAR